MGNIVLKIHGLLKWSEKYTKLDMVYLARGGFWFSFGHIISTVLTFALAITFANRIPADIYGTYKFLLSFIGILSISTLSGMGPFLSQAVARGMEGSFFEALRAKITWGLLGGAGGMILSLYYYINGNMELSLAFLVASFFVPFMDSFHIYQDYLQGKKLFDVSIKYISISQVVATMVIISTLFVTENLYAIILSYLSSYTVTRFFFLTRTIKKFPPNKNVDPGTVSYGKNSSFVDVIATLIGSVDQILIFHFLGPVQLAIYSFAIAPISQLVSPFRSLPILAMPKLAVKPVNEVNSVLEKRILVAFGIAILVIVVYVLLSPLFFKTLFPKYIDSIYFSQIYALTMLFTIPNTVLGSAVTSKINLIPKKMFYFWNIPGALSTIFILAFIQKIGLISIVYARILLVATSMVLGLCFWIYILNKNKNIPTSNTDPKFP